MIGERAAAKLFSTGHNGGHDARRYLVTLNMNYRRWAVVCTVLVGSIVAVVGYVTGAVVSAAIFVVIQGLVLALLLWLTRPSDSAAHLSHAAAQAAASDGDVIVYWMPDCIYCDLLKRGLGSGRHDVSWVNISSDAEAAEFVTTQRDGNETVPTAVTGAGQMINATPAAIKAQLRAAS